MTNLTNYQDSLASPESRQALQQEYLNRIIESFGQKKPITQGIVVYADNNAITSNGKKVTSIRIRAKGLQDSFIPDIPSLFESDKPTNRMINTCLECHPVIYPKISIDESESSSETIYYGASQGDIVQLLRDENDTLTYGKKIGTDRRYTDLVYDFTPSNASNPASYSGDPSATGAFRNNVKNQISAYQGADQQKITDEIAKAYPNSKDFAFKIVEVANNLGTNPYWLANLINFETAGTFSPTIVNSLGYTGLIQFGTKGKYAAIKDLGITKEQLLAMTAVQQMDQVQRYYELPHKRRGSDYSNPIDLYMAVFYPLGIGKPDYKFPEKVIKANNGIDTPREYARRANRNAKLPTGM